jgi:hypothetical protein
MSELDPVEFDAIIYKVQTLVDMGLRITLDLPENAIIAAAQLMALRRSGAVIHITATPDKQPVSVGKENGKISAGTIRKSSRATA